MKVTIIGTGFVGVVSAAVYASLGHEVVGLDVDEKKVASLKQGTVPFFEPDLEELLVAQQAKGTLHFTTSYQEAITGAEVVIIAVGTPSSANGQVNLEYVFAATESCLPYLVNGVVVAIKSTVPPGTLDQLRQRVAGKTSISFEFASLPEFLREGSAVKDTLEADRVVIGADSPEARQVLSKLHQKLPAQQVFVSAESAQMGKYTANAYLATRITFINQIADLCEKNGADIEEVIKVISPDHRIGSHYWYPGLGYGGSCFPKDVSELAHYAISVGEPDNLMITINKLNSQRIPKMLAEFSAQIDGWDGKQVTILGLSFKPNTNDMREAPSIKVVEYLRTQHNVKITGYDPKAVEVADYFIKPGDDLKYVSTLEESIKSADVIIALIEWSEIVRFDFAAHKLDKPQWFIDTRNQFDFEVLTKAGYHYIGIGR